MKIANKMNLESKELINCLYADIYSALHYQYGNNVKQTEICDRPVEVVTTVDCIAAFGPLAVIQGLISKSLITYSVFDIPTGRFGVKADSRLSCLRPAWQSHALGGQAGRRPKAIGWIAGYLYFKVHAPVFHCN